MQYRQLGASGLIVSRLALGVMTFGKGVGGRFGGLYTVDQSSADALVKQAMDAGVNYFNTADMYAEGRSEEILGQVLGKSRRDVVIGTKCGLRSDPSLLHAGLSRRHIIASCDASLRRLGTDWIDVYLAHAEDPLTPLDETLAAFDHLVRQGKVRYTGFSNWPAWRAAQAVAEQRAAGGRPFVAAELYYSLLGRDVEAELMPFAAQSGIGVTVWSPLAGGLLTGRYRHGGDSSGRLSQFDAIRVDPKEAEPVVDAVVRIAGEVGVTPAQVSLAWLLSREVSSILLGTSSAAQLADTLGAAKVTLDAAHLTQLDAVSAPRTTYPHWLNRDFADKARQDAIGIGA